MGGALSINSNRQDTESDWPSVVNELESEDSKRKDKWTCKRHCNNPENQNYPSALWSNYNNTLHLITDIINDHKQGEIVDNNQGEHDSQKQNDDG